MFTRKNKIKYNIIVALFFITTIAGCETEKEKEARVQQCYHELREQFSSKCESACEINPIDTYCSMIYSDHVIGSGCTSTIEYMAKFKENETSYEKEQKLVAVCKKSACETMIDDAENIKARFLECQK